MPKSGQINYSEISEISQKAFDSMSDVEKLEGFNDLLEKIENNKSVLKLKDKWNKLTEEEKMKLYKKDATNILNLSVQGVKYTTFMYPNASLPKNRLKNGKGNALDYAVLQYAPCRGLVELGILEKPSSLSTEQLMKDIKKDAKNFNLYLLAGEAVCCVYCPEVIPLIQAARRYSKWFQSNTIPVMQERIRKQEKKNIEKDIAITLSSVEENIVEKDVKKKKAA